MSNALLLDGLLAAIALLCVPIGFWRGVLKEVFVTVGLLVGAALAAAWARPWGADLAELLDLRLGTAQFVVAMIALAGSALLLGYGGGVAAAPGTVELRGRIAGAALAAINGALLVTYTLLYVDRFLADEATKRAIDESLVARFVVDQVGWVLLGLAAMAGFGVLIALLFGREPMVALTPPAPPEGGLDRGPARAPRLVWGRDDDKVEPAARGFDPAEGRFAADAPNVSQTMAVPIVEPKQAPGGRFEPNADFTGGEWFERASALRPDGNGNQAPVVQRCPACGEVVGRGEAFCPRCGRSQNRGLDG